MEFRQQIAQPGPARKGAGQGGESATLAQSAARSICSATTTPAAATNFCQSPLSAVGTSPRCSSSAHPSSG